eukprot:32107_1
MTICYLYIITLIVSSKSSKTLDCSQLFGAGNDCIIDCSSITSSGNCSNYIIDASSANLFELNCNTIDNRGFGCFDSTIKCPVIGAKSCHIKCNEYKSCTDSIIQINSNMMNSINLECSGNYSCYDISLSLNNVFQIDSLYLNFSGSYSFYQSSLYINSAINKTEIYCNDINSCYGSTINISNLAFSTVNINCSNNNIMMTTPDRSHSACSQATFQIDESEANHGTSNISISCLNKYDCYGTSFNISYGDIVIMDCDSINGNGCTRSKINATNANSFQMACHNSGSCYLSSIYCPHSSINSCKISCTVGNNPCNNIGIFVPNDYVYNYLNLTCLGSPGGNGLCDNDDIYDMQIFCDMNGDDENAKTTVHLNSNNTCNCQTPLCCCPFLDDRMVINFDEYQDYSINCTTWFKPQELNPRGNCINKIINATNALSLTVYCLGYHSCQYIICPINGKCSIKCIYHSTCYSGSINYFGVINNINAAANMYIECMGDYSCNGIQITVPNIFNVTVICNETKSCTSLDLYAHHAQTVTVNCLVSDACQNYNIYAPYSNNFVLNCLASDACRNGDINTTNTANITINATDNGAFAVNNLYAFDSSSIFISCLSPLIHNYAAPNNVGSYKNTLYVNASALTLKCYGIGCYGLTFSTYYANDYLYVANISVNGCDQCYSLSSCINEWDMQCHSYGQYSKFDGDSCSNHYCGCTDQFQPKFINDNTDLLCLNMTPIPTPSPTTSPIPTQKPTAKPTPKPISSPTYPTKKPTPYSSSTDDSSMDWWPVPLGVIVGVILVILLIIRKFRRISASHNNVQNIYVHVPMINLNARNDDEGQQNVDPQEGEQERL